MRFIYRFASDVLLWGDMRFNESQSLIRRLLTIDNNLYNNTVEL